MKRTEKSTANGRQKKKAEPTAGKANQRTANRDKAKYEEKHSTKESCSHIVPDVQPGKYELKLGEVIPAINFNKETVECKNANCSDSSEAATQKVQKIVVDSLGLKEMYDGSQPSS